MPTQSEVNRVTGNLESFLNNNTLVDSKNIITNAADIYNEFQNFRKLLATCSTSDGSSINDIVEELRIFAEDGYKSTTYFKNPEKIACFASGIIGLTDFANGQISEITKDLQTYKKGFLPFLDEVWRGIYQEFNPGKFGDEFEKQIEFLSSNLLDVGTTLLSGVFSDTIKKGEDFIDSKLKKYYGKIGTYLSFLTIASNEFKWATYLIFIENLKSQIESRINNLISLKNSIRNLIFEVDINNKQTTSLTPKNLDNYILALKTLEDTLLLTKNLDKNLVVNDVFNKVLNDGIINNLDEAKKLLLNQKNNIISEYLGEEVIPELTDPNLTYDLILPDNIFQRSDLLMVDKTSDEINPEQILDDLKNIKNIFIQASKDYLEYNSINPYISSLNLRQTKWLEFRKPLEEEIEYLRINERIVKVKSSLTVNSEVEKVDSGFTDKDPLDKNIYFVEVEPINSEYYSRSNFLNTFGTGIPYITLELNVDYTINFSTTHIELTEETYVITETDKTVLNTINFLNSGLLKIKSKWSSRNDWIGLLFLDFSIDDVTEHGLLEFTGEMPTFPNTTKTEVTKVNEELPEPMNSILNKFKNFNGDVGDYTNLGGELSTFLYGKDILNGPFNKWGNYLNSYSKFIKTSSSVLESFCPLKNTIYSFYLLFEQANALGEKHNNMSTLITRDWILKLNNIITNTISIMTFKNELGEYSTIDEIENSSIYYKLIPSLLLDYDNINTLGTIANFNNNLGDLFNNNSLLESKFKEFDDFVLWLKDGDKLNKLKSTEQEMWGILGGTFINGLKLILNGENISNLKLVFDSVESKIDNLIIDLSTVNEKMSILNEENFSSHTQLIKLFNDIGLPHFIEYIKNGNVDTFIKKDVGEWMGKHGETIACVNSLANRYFAGQDKSFLLSVVDYMQSVDIGELLTLADSELLNMDFSVNINFINKVSQETINNLKSKIKKASAAINSARILKEKQ